MSKERYKLTIEPITAVHIGTGEKLTPLDYKLTNDIENIKFPKPKYVKFSSDKILQKLIEENNQIELAKFEKASSASNMKELQTFFQRNCQKISDIDYVCDSITNGFLKSYNSNINKDPYENAAMVLQLYRPEGLKTPVIPGSSLKGSIRTAVLNLKMHNLSDKSYDELYNNFSNQKRNGKYERRIQEFLLKDNSSINFDAKTDPFRCIQITDAAFSARNSQLIGQLKNISLNKFDSEIKAIDMQIQAEFLTGLLSNNTPISSEISLSIDTDLQSTHTPKFSTEIITMQEIIDSCNYFFWREFEKEYINFYKPCVDSVDKITNLAEILKSIKETPNTFMIRVGRWSQVEFVTFEDNFREPKTPKIKGKQMGYGGTRTVLDYNGQYLPIGWCKCSVKKMN